MADALSYNVRGFKLTWRDTVMTTSSHRYSSHHLELWSDARKIDFVIDMCCEAGQVWVLAALTRPGAEQIPTVAAAGDYLSTHMPEESPPGDSGALHALRGGLRGPVQCYGCQELGHVITNCPHRAEGAGAQGATLTYNGQARRISAPTPVRKKWRMQ